MTTTTETCRTHGEDIDPETGRCPYCRRPRSKRTTLTADPLAGWGIPDGQLALFEEGEA